MIHFMAENALAILCDCGRAVEDYLRQALTRYGTAPPRLIQAIEYSLLAGGKRLRPALVLETARACGEGSGFGVQNSEGPTWQSALAAAGAVELIHTFSLVHDDLPAMDDDDLRRGKPTSHKVFGEAMAILAGDAMVAMAFELLASDAEPSIAPQLIAELARATGPSGMIGGQVLDMEGESKRLYLEELQHLHRMKTGALLTVSCRLGALSAGADRQVIDAITRFGQHLGLAFQIVDDCLDETAIPEQLGKATQKDARKGKNTYPGLLGLDPSRRRAKEELDAALDALSPLGSKADRLRTLARFVVEREK